MVSRTLNSQAITNCIVRGEAIVALARPRNPQSPGYSLLLEGTDPSRVAAIGDEARERIQRAGIEERIEPKKLLSRLLSFLENASGLDGAGIIVHHNQRAWLATVGGVRAYKWTATDSLAPLSPWRPPSRGMRWFRPKKSIELEETDRLLLTSRACSSLFQAEKLLYLHSNETDSWLGSQIREAYGVAWSGGARTSGSIRNSGELRALSEGEANGAFDFSSRLRLGLFLVGMVAAGTGVGTLLVQSAEDGSESNAPQTERFAASPPTPPGPLPEKDPAILPTRAEEGNSRDTGEQEGDPEALPDWLSDFCSLSTDLGRQTRYLLEGQHREALRALPAPPDLLEPKDLPKEFHPFFVPSPRANPRLFASQFEEKLRSSLSSAISSSSRNSKAK